MVKIGIVGGSGYGAIELIRLLQTHPHIMTVHVYSHSEIDEPLKLTFPHLQHIMQHFEALTVGNNDYDVIFFATPTPVSETCIPPLVEKGIRVISLSDAPRIKDREIYEAYYKEAAATQGDLNHTIYSISEWQSLDNDGTRLISNPSCFPTATLLALHLLTSEKTVDLSSVVIDAKTGMPGASRSLSQRVHFSEMSENLSACAIEDHKHKPEIEQYLSIIAGQDVSVMFTPHLVPIAQGILSTVYVELSSEYTTESLHKLVTSYCANRPFVRVRDIGTFPTTKEVLGSNCCDTGIYVGEIAQTAILVSAINNLAKGANGQVIRNLDTLYDFEATTSLKQSPVYP